jgi:hypothetical protein
MSQSNDAEMGDTARMTDAVRAVDAVAPVAQRLTAARVAVGTLRERVKSDQLQLDPAAGDEILSLLTEQMNRVDTWLDRARGLTRRAPLGRNPVGEAMAAKFENRAGGGDNSLAAVLTPYRNTLQEAHDAVREAMRRYQQVEHDHVELFKKLAP